MERAHKIIVAYYILVVISLIVVPTFPFINSYLISNYWPNLLDSVDDLTLFVISMAILSPPFLLMPVGIALFAKFRKDEEERKLIKSAFYLNLITVFIVLLLSSVLVAGQQLLFSQDSRNMEQRDTFLFKAYSLTKISDAWDIANQKVQDPIFATVGIIDTGADAANSRHPEFRGVTLNALSPELFKDSKSGGHGTQVAGIIGANNVSFPNFSNYSFPQMNGILSGVHKLSYSLELGKKPLTALTLYSLASTIDALSKRNVKVINMSFANPIPRVSLIGAGVFSKIFSKKSDILFVVPAGQLTVFGFELPAVDAELITPANFGNNFDNVITVGATDIVAGFEDHRVPPTNFGSAVNVSAPGVAVYSPAPRGQGNFPTSTLDYDQFFSGTSASAPLVTGVAAILKALEPEYQKYSPGLQMTPAKIKEILISSADPINTGEPDKRLGTGCYNQTPQDTGCRLNAHRAVSWLFPPASTTLVVSSANSNSIFLAWTLPPDFAEESPDFDSYRIYRATSPNVSIGIANLIATIAATSTLSLTDTNLSPNTTYYYKLFVFDKAGLSSASNEVSAVTSDSQTLTKLFEIVGGAIGGGQGIGVGSHKVAVGQTISPEDITPGTIKAIELTLSRVGNPTDNVIVSLRYDLSGPDLASATISAAPISAYPRGDKLTVTLNSPVSSSNVRALYLRRSGPQDFPNYLQVMHGEQTDQYPNGNYFECPEATPCNSGGAPFLDIPMALLGDPLPTPSALTTGSGLGNRITIPLMPMGMGTSTQSGI